MQPNPHQVFKKIVAVHTQNLPNHWSVPSICSPSQHKQSQSKQECATFEISPQLCRAAPNTPMQPCANSACKNHLHVFCGEGANQRLAHPYCLECCLLESHLGSRFTDLLSDVVDLSDGQSVKFDVNAETCKILGSAGARSDESRLGSGSQSGILGQSLNTAQLVFRYGVIPSVAALPKKKSSPNYIFRVLLDGWLVGMISAPPESSGVGVGTIKLGIPGRIGKHSLKLVSTVHKEHLDPEMRVFGVLGIVVSRCRDHGFQSLYQKQRFTLLNPFPVSEAVTVVGQLCTKSECIFELETHLKENTDYDGYHGWTCPNCRVPLLFIDRVDPSIHHEVNLLLKIENSTRRESLPCLANHPTRFSQA